MKAKITLLVFPLIAIFFLVNPSYTIAQTPTMIPTPTDQPQCSPTNTTSCCEPNVNDSCDSNLCCHANNLVCVPGHGAEGRGATCQKCNLGHLQSCVVGDYSNPNNCCQAQYTCASLSTSGNNPQCLTQSEFENQPTVDIKNPCPSGVCQTAIGPIQTDPYSFIQVLFRVILSLSGGVAIMLIVWGGYRLALSQGNPEKVQQAREFITSAVIGLLFIIFSVAILQIIGMDVLGLTTIFGK